MLNNENDDENEENGEGELDSDKNDDDDDDEPTLMSRSKHFAKQVYLINFFFCNIPICCNLRNAV